MESTFHKHAHGDFKTMLIENDKMVLKNEEVAKEFNKYFGHITDSLDLFEFPYEKVGERLDDINNIVCKFSIEKLRKGAKLRVIFSFRLITTEEIKTIIRDHAPNKTVRGEIPVNTLKKPNFSFDKLTICVNHALINGKFLSTLENTYVTLADKKNDPTDQTSFRPVSTYICNALRDLVLFV